MSNYHYKPPKNAQISNQKLFDDLESVCESLGTRKLSQKVYDENGNFSVATYKKRFGSWNNALEQAGLEITEQIKKISLDDLVNDIPSTVKEASAPASFCFDPFVVVLSMVESPDPDGLSVAVILNAFSFPSRDFNTRVNVLSPAPRTLAVTP